MNLRIYEAPESIPEAPAGGRVVAIGVFDGVHRGHQRILREAVERARLVDDSVVAAVTFRPHPEAVLRPERAPRQLTALDRKAELMDALGVEELMVVRFDRAFADLSPADFCAQVLSRRLGARLVLVGENFRFGHHAVGGPEDLRQYGREHGFETSTVPLSEEDGKTISSTRIRGLIGSGHVAEATRLLGRPHRIEGVVVAGVGRGRTLSAPTANLAVEAETALPRHGVYVTRSLLSGMGAYASVTSVGTNPTFEADGVVRIETLLLDYEGDIYGARMAVDFLEWIRGQQRFAGPDVLAERIRLDVEAARGFLSRRPDLLDSN